MCRTSFTCHPSAEYFHSSTPSEPAPTWPSKFRQAAAATQTESSPDHTTWHIEVDIGREKNVNVELAEVKKVCV